LFRLTRYSMGIQLIKDTFYACRKELTVVATGLGTILFLAASVLNIAEREAQPETFGSFFTSLWWGICTLTTVGYGDVYPVTAFGRFSAAVIAVVGIGAFALPSGIIAAHFNDILQRAKNRDDLT
ncbi:MAG: potassium channel family protein, partial [Planctomycetes bacterium]|nr:potassium channel family protein [Planctomycetota bacterium]